MWKKNIVNPKVLLDEFQPTGKVLQRFCMCLNEGWNSWGHEGTMRLPFPHNNFCLFGIGLQLFTLFLGQLDVELFDKAPNVGNQLWPNFAFKRHQGQNVWKKVSPQNCHYFHLSLRLPDLGAGLSPDPCTPNPRRLHRQGAVGPHVTGWNGGRRFILVCELNSGSINHRQYRI